MVSDLMYYLSLLGCIALGRQYKEIDDPATKRNFGTGLGMLVVFLLCGQLVLHSALMVWGNIVIIKCCKKTYLHHLSFAYTWLYLIFLHYNIDVSSNYASSVLWLHQVIALRVVGLAFEIALVEKSKRQSTVESLSSMQEIKTIVEEPVDPSVVDVISYAYFFVGLHKGPYYRWKTFNEHFEVPFGMLGNWRIITEQKLKKAFAFSFAYVLLSLLFSDGVYRENNFYYAHGTDYRYLYNIPQMLKYVLGYQVLMLLCTSVFTEAGFGVYPCKTHPMPGRGPSAGLLQFGSFNEEEALEDEYNFAMIRSFENEKLLKGPRLSDSLKGWDMSSRYWFWKYSYKNIMIRTNKDVRSAFSYLAWGVWGGFKMQQLIVCSTMWVHVRLEREYSETYSANIESVILKKRLDSPFTALYRNRNHFYDYYYIYPHSWSDRDMKSPWNIGFSIMRVFCLIYLTPCLILDDYSVVLRYYNSIYWVYHIILLLLILGAVILQKNQMLVTTESVTA